MTADADGFGEPDVPFEAAVPPVAAKRAAHPSGAGLNGHTVDAEGMVLSSIFMDGADAASRCIADGITERSFDGPQNRILFQTIHRLYSTNNPIALDTVAQELTSSGLLEAVGGYNYLISVTEKAPTTAQLPYFLKKLKEAEGRREIAAIGKLAASVDEYAGEMSDLIGHLRSRLDVIENGRRSGQLTERLYNHAKQIPKPSAIFTLDGTTICTPGNLTTLLSQAKAGKSAVVGGMIAASMLSATDEKDTLGIVGPNYGKGALLHFDTEQSPYDWQNSIKTALRRAGVQAPPSWLMSFTLTGLPAAECRYMLGAAVREAVRRHGSIFAIILDGTADLVIDPNDSKECFPLISELHDLAIRNNTSIINVLHMNPGKDQEKARGHLGSQLERKSESNLMLHKSDDGVTAIWGTKQRGKMILKKDAHKFRWDDAAQMHITTKQAEEDTGGGRKAKPEFFWSDYAKMLPYADGKPVNFNQFLRMTLEVPTKSGLPLEAEDLRRMLKAAVDAGTVLQHGAAGRGLAFTRAEKAPEQAELLP